MSNSNVNSVEAWPPQIKATCSSRSLVELLLKMYWKQIFYNNSRAKQEMERCLWKAMDPKMSKPDGAVKCARAMKCPRRTDELIERSHQTREKIEAGICCSKDWSMTSLHEHKAELSKNSLITWTSLNMLLLNQTFLKMLTYKTLLEQRWSFCHYNKALILTLTKVTFKHLVWVNICLV